MTNDEIIAKESLEQLKRFNKALGDLAAVLRKDEAEIITAQGRIVARRMIDYTPMPRSMAKGPLKTAAKKVIERYFRFAAPTLRAKDWTSASIRKAIAGKDYGQVSAIVSRIRGRAIEVKPWDPQLVYKAMNARGQVLKPVSGVAVFEDAQYKADLRKAQDAAGKAKGGWASGAEALGGKVAAWIKAQSGEGTYIDLRKAKDPSFELINNSAWGRRSDEAARIRNAAIKGSTAAMVKRMQIMAEKEMQKVARKTR